MNPFKKRSWVILKHAKGTLTYEVVTVYKTTIRSLAAIKEDLQKISIIRTDIYDRQIFRQKRLDLGLT